MHACEAAVGLRRIACVRSNEDAPLTPCPMMLTRITWQPDRTKRGTAAQSLTFASNSASYSTHPAVRAHIGMSSRATRI